MSVFDLKAMINRGDLLDFRFESDHLRQTFRDLIAIITDQQQQISDLKISLSGKAEKSQLLSFQNQAIENYESIAKSIPFIEKRVDHLYLVQEKKEVSTKNYIDETLNSFIASVDRKIVKKLDEDSNESAQMIQRIEAIEQTISTPKTNSVSSTEVSALSKRLAKLENQITNLKTTTDNQSAIDEMREDFNTRFYELLSRMDKMEQNMEETDEEPVKTKTIIEKIVSEPAKIPDFSKDFAKIESSIEEKIRMVISKVERKADVTTVERMFEKLRTIVSAIKDETAMSAIKTEHFVTPQELEEYIQKAFISYEESQKGPFKNDPIPNVVLSKQLMKQKDLSSKRKSIPREASPSPR